MKTTPSQEFVLKSMLVVAVLSLMGAQVRVGPTAGWQHLGNAHVDGQEDHDKIDVPGGAFTALQMAVSNGAIRFQQVVVHFRNGGDEVLAVAERVPSGGRTQPILLRGGTRQIKSVEIWYAKGKYAEGKPEVQLFGRR